jgi:two-component system cell cycle sensor histidine kinase/response regulator CckA
MVEAGSRSGTDILLVEDDAQVRELLSRILLDAGYDIIEAESPAVALKLCQDALPRIKLIITDLIMPGMNGRELVTAIQRVQPGIAVIYMSGSSLFTSGIPPEAFLQKPFRADVLLSKVRECLPLELPLRNLSA